MIAPAGPTFRVVLYEGNDSRPLDDVRRFEVMRALLEKGHAVTMCRDGGRVSGAGTGTILVLGQFETADAANARVPFTPSPGTPGEGGGEGGGGNAEFGMLNAESREGTEALLPSSAFSIQHSAFPQDPHPNPLPEYPERGQEAITTAVHLREIAGLDTAAVISEVESVRSATSAPASGKWKPWFPVIDYGRCTNCMQCLSFCLFDVYGVTKEGKIQVQNENNCKTDCPACSRVCPEVAILFPKYRFGPVNGDEINPEDLRREAMKVDISALLGGDIYAALRDRSEKAKSRFSKERDEDRALKERQRCLEKLHQAMDIPAEVLASLPSVDQIQVKAQQAKARAEAALRMQANPA